MRMLPAGVNYLIRLNQVAREERGEGVEGLFG